MPKKKKKIAESSSGSEEQEAPEPEPKPKRQKIAKPTPLPPPAPETKIVVPEPESTDTKRRFPPMIIINVFQRLKHWKDKTVPNPETYESLSVKYGKHIETAPSLKFIFDDEPMSDDDHLRFLLFLLSIEAIWYPETPERYEALTSKIAQVREFPPFAFDMIEQPQAPPDARFTVAYDIIALTPAARQKAKKEVQQLFDEADQNNKAQQEATAAWKKGEKEKRAIFSSGLTYDQMADAFTENPSYYFDTIRKRWAQRKLQIQDLKRGPTEYFNFNLLCLRYWEARKHREVKEEVAATPIQTIEEYVVEDSTFD
jgi:hypothetical protein